MDKIFTGRGEGEMTKVEQRICIMGAVLIGVGFATAFILGNTAPNLVIAGVFMVTIPMIRDIRRDNNG